MRERPIIFTGESVRAILEGLKTQTRRVVRGIPSNSEGPFEPAMAPGIGETSNRWAMKVDGKFIQIRCPYGKPGDRLWVKETWSKSPDGPIYKAAVTEHGITECDDCIKWKSSMFMPRWASRITLEIKGVRVERVQAISETDARAEGCDDQHILQAHPPHEAFRKPTAREAYRVLWDSINAKRGFGWDKNPWVWVMEFRKI